MKYIILTIYLLLSILNYCSAQRKADKAYPAVVIEKQSAPLTRATGWDYNEISRRWYANANTISDHPVHTYESSYSSPTFSWLRTAVVRYESKKYYMLYFGDRKDTPLYQLHSANTDGIQFCLTDSAGYFEFKKALLAKDGKTIALRSPIANDEFIHDGKTSLEESIAKEISRSTGYMFTAFYASTQRLDGEDIARFRLPESFGMFDHPDLNRGYFEVPLLEFMQIFVE